MMPTASSHFLKPSEHSNMSIQVERLLVEPKPIKNILSYQAAKKIGLKNPVIMRMCSFGLRFKLD